MIRTVISGHIGSNPYDVGSRGWFYPDLICSFQPLKEKVQKNHMNYGLKDADNDINFRKKSVSVTFCWTIIF